MQTISDLWKGSIRLVEKEAEIAFSKHLHRMKDLKIDYQPATASMGANAAPEDSDPDAVGYYAAGRDVTGSDITRSDAAGTDGGPRAEKRAKSGRPALLLSLLSGALLVMAWFFNRAPHSPAVPGHTANVTTPADSEIFTSGGSRTHLTLPDGTLVWLNAGSRLTYYKNYGTSFREVNLMGEAFFDVAKNAEKPFLTHTARLDIKVLGTRFNVKSYPTDPTTEATLLHGSIEVSIKARPSEKIILQPNEKLIVANDDSTLHRTTVRSPGAHEESLVSIRQPTYEQATGAVIETSWVEDRLAFRDQEFSVLAKDMERWYGVNIRFDNTDQQHWHFTGNFQKETIQQALDALKLTAAFTYTIHENQITIYDR